MKIILNIDNPDTNTLEGLVNDVSQLRDILATIVREYHLKGDDKVDDLRNEFSSIKDDMKSLSASFEEAKNHLAIIESDNLRYKEEFSAVSKLVSNFNEKWTKTSDDITLKLKDTVTKVNEMSPKRINAESESIGAVSLRLSELIKKVSNIEEFLSNKNIFSTYSK